MAWQRGEVDRLNSICQQVMADHGRLGPERLRVGVDDAPVEAPHARFPGPVLDGVLDHHGEGTVRGMPRLIQHKAEAYWFFRFLSPLYDRWVNPLFWTAEMRADAG